MERDEILAMPAGRDVDCLVAERVMGWTNIRLGPSVNGAPCPVGEGPDGEHGTVPAYSTDIAAAFGVLVKSQEETGCRSYLERNKAFVWEVDLGTATAAVSEFEPQINFDSKRAAALAICRAALLVANETLEPKRETS